LTLGFSACTTDANHRDLYAPRKANGPYTRALRDGTWDNGVKPADEEYAKPKKSTMTMTE